MWFFLRISGKKQLLLSYTSMTGIYNRGEVFSERYEPSLYVQLRLTFWRRNYFFNLNTPCIQNVNNTGTKQVTIMKQPAF